MSFSAKAKLTLWQGANLAFAQKPRFVIIGVARSGTKYTATYFTQIGIRCSHEGYFTPSGPKLRNRHRSFRCRGDVSWMAVPFAGESGITWIHQVRDPISVVRSLYKFGFFDLRCAEPYRRFRNFLVQHFEIGPTPLENCIRWYIEWNGRAEQAAAYRYRIEDFEQELPQIIELTGEGRTDRRPDISTDLNRRPPVFNDWEEQLDARIHAHPLFPQLATLGRRYGYDI